MNNGKTGLVILGILAVLFVPMNALPFQSQKVRTCTFEQVSVSARHNIVEHVDKTRYGFPLAFFEKIIIKDACTADETASSQSFKYAGFVVDLFAAGVAAVLMYILVEKMSNGSHK